MIKSAFGETEMKAILGKAELMADLSCIIVALCKQDIDPEDIMDTVKKAIEDKDEPTDDELEEDEVMDQIADLMEELSDAIKSRKKNNAL